MADVAEHHPEHHDVGEAGERRRVQVAIIDDGVGVDEGLERARRSLRHDQRRRFPPAGRERHHCPTDVRQTGAQRSELCARAPSHECCDRAVLHGARAHPLELRLGGQHPEQSLALERRQVRRLRIEHRVGMPRIDLCPRRARSRASPAGPGAFSPDRARPQRRPHRPSPRARFGAGRSVRRPRRSILAGSSASGHRIEQLHNVPAAARGDLQHGAGCARRRRREGPPPPRSRSRPASSDACASPDTSRSDHHRTCARQRSSGSATPSKAFATALGTWRASSPADVSSCHLDPNSLWASRHAEGPNAERAPAMSTRHSTMAEPEMAQSPAPGTPSSTRRAQPSESVKRTVAGSSPPGSPHDEEASAARTSLGVRAAETAGQAVAMEPSAYGPGTFCPSIRAR